MNRNSENWAHSKLASRHKLAAQDWQAEAPTKAGASRAFALKKGKPK
jgi:hypothetical protein